MRFVVVIVIIVIIIVFMIGVGPFQSFRSTARQFIGSIRVRVGIHDGDTRRNGVLWFGCFTRGHPSVVVYRMISSVGVLAHSFSHSVNQSNTQSLCNGVNVCVGLDSCSVQQQKQQ